MYICVLLLLVQLGLKNLADLSDLIKWPFISRHGQRTTTMITSVSSQTFISIIFSKILL